MGCPIERCFRTSRSLHQLLLGDRQCVNESLHRRLAVTPAPLMRTLIVVFGEPDIKIFLQLRDRAVEFLAECNAVELIEQRLVEALANAVRLRAPRLSARVIDVLDREVELIFVVLGLSVLASWWVLPCLAPPVVRSTRLRLAPLTTGNDAHHFVKNVRSNPNFYS